MEHLPTAEAAVWVPRADGPRRVSRQDMASRWRGELPFKLVLQLSGQAEVRQAGRCAELAPGDFTLLDGQQDFTVAMPAAFEQLVVMLPHRALAARHRGIEHRTAVAHGRLPAERVLGDLLGAVSRQAGQLPPGAQVPLQTALCELVGALAPPCARPSAATLLEQAKAFIECELADIRPVDVAAHLRVSRRYLDTLFAREGGTVMQYVWERRLVNAASRLARRTARAVTVTEVAHACGFQDASHFSRMFRQRFGRSPSAWRGTD